MVRTEPPLDGESPVSHRNIASSNFRTGRRGLEGRAQETLAAQEPWLRRNRGCRLHEFSGFGSAARVLACNLGKGRNNALKGRIALFRWFRV